MLETLYPLDLPAGCVNNGTTYQSKGRWFTGNLVRFFQKTIQPLGGWVARSTTGATITGTPNACFSWTMNDGTTWLAIGTTLGLYVVSSSNVVYDITPTANYTTPASWTLCNFGQYLLAVTVPNAPSLPFYNAYVWQGDTTQRAALAYANDTGPNGPRAVVATPERFLVLLQGADWSAVSYGSTFVG